MLLRRGRLLLDAGRRGDFGGRANAGLLWFNDVLSGQVVLMEKISRTSRCPEQGSLSLLVVVVVVVAMATMMVSHLILPFHPLSEIKQAAHPL